MNRHISNEVLSAYLDDRVDLRFQKEVDTHLTACEHCRTQLDSLRGVVSSLSRVGRVAPPPGLAQRIRQQAMEQPVSPWARLRDLIVALPRRADLRTHMAMAMALVVSVSLVVHGVERKQRELLASQGDPEGKVTVSVGVPDGSYNLPTAQFGGRTFFWADGADVFVEEGVDATQATTRVDTYSPQGQAILKSSFGEEDRVAVAAALDHGSRMVLQVNASPVELSTQQRHL
jgi:anti-sigma factor RsiW